MKAKRFLSLLLCLLLAAGCLLTGCGRKGEEPDATALVHVVTEDEAPVYAAAEKPWSVLDGERLEDCSLALCYANSSETYSCIIYNEEDLDYRVFGISVGGMCRGVPFSTRMVIPGSRLVGNEQFLALLDLLDGREPLRGQGLELLGRLDMRASVYYVLRSKDGRVLFDVGLGKDNLKRPGRGWGASYVETVWFNGEKLPYDELFYHSMYPYMTEEHFIEGDHTTRIQFSPSLMVNNQRIQEGRVRVLDRGIYFARLPLLKTLEALGIPVEWKNSETARFRIGEQEYTVSLRDKTLREKGSDCNCIVPGDMIPSCYLPDVYSSGDELYLDNYCLISTLEGLGLHICIDWRLGQNLIVIYEGEQGGNMNVPRYHP